MSLIVEDGTGMSNSESYVSVAFADQYFSDRNNTTWGSIATSLKEGYLRQATDYMLQKYRLRWTGRRWLTTQALDWPRSGVVRKDFNDAYGYYGSNSNWAVEVPYNIVPLEIQKACAELALRATLGTLSVDQKQNVLRKTVGPITVEYDSNSSQQKSYIAVDGLLNVFFTAEQTGNMVKLVRV